MRRCEAEAAAASTQRQRDAFVATVDAHLTNGFVCGVCVSYSGSAGRRAGGGGVAARVACRRKRKRRRGVASSNRARGHAHGYAGACEV